ncbi:MAG: hypothetical protein ACR2QA_13980 [Solirubrobacteraceae bacterium]
MDGFAVRGSAAAVVAVVVEVDVDLDTERWGLLGCDVPQPIIPAASTASQMTPVFCALLGMAIASLRVDEPSCRNLAIT